MQAVKEKCQLAINTLENEPCLQRDATVCIGGPELGYHALRTALVAESEPVDQVGPLLVGAEMTAKTVFGNARDSFGNGREELSKVCVCVNTGCGGGELLYCSNARLKQIFCHDCVRACPDTYVGCQCTGHDRRCRSRFPA